MKRLSLAVVGSAVLLAASCSTPTDTTTPLTDPPGAMVDQTTPTTAAISATTSTTSAAPSTTTPGTTDAPPPTELITTTTVTAPLLPDIWRLADDLFCRDLHELGYAYPEAALYWSTFDTPDRMDADRNGIPCETVYPQADVEAFWGESAGLGTTTIPEVAAWVQRWYDDAFVGADLPDEITGPLQVQCADTWPVDVGDTFVCRGVPQTERPNMLETASLLILVLDPSGTAIWSAGTDLPDDTAGLRYTYHLTPKGLSCEDLADPSFDAGTFGGSSRPPDDAFFYAMVYWALEGRPSYMDPDGNGIPCEGLTSSENVETILQGGPVPLYVRG